VVRSPTRPIGADELQAVCRAGQVLDGGNRHRPIEAEILRRWCLDHHDEVDPRGIRLRNTRIVGVLDLAGIQLPFPLSFVACDFAAAPILEGAELHSLALTGCQRLPGLLANGLRVRRDLDLSGSEITGGHITSASTSKRAAIWLCESEIGGRLLCVDTVIRADGERALQADRMQVGGTVRLLHGFTAVGELRLLGVQIAGSLDLTGASIDHPAGLALDLGDAAIGGSVFLIEDQTRRRPVIRGRIDLGSARISGQLLIRDATLEGSSTAPTGGGYTRAREGGTAISGPRLEVGGEVAFEGECQVDGGLDLSLSELSGLSIEGSCTFRAPGRTALNLTNAELRSSLMLRPEATIEGTVRLTGARIHGNLTMQRAVLASPEGRSVLAGQGLAVDGDVELQGLRAAGGGLRFRNATLGSVMDLAGAQLDYPAGQALTLHQAIVKGSVRLVEGFRSRGLVMLNRSMIEGRLDCRGGSFECVQASKDNLGGHALEATSATIRGGMYLGWETITPSVDFTNTTTTILADDPGDWPERFVVSGLTYDRFDEPFQVRSNQSWDRQLRCAWLARQARYDSGPYEQAARVFRQHGYITQAEEILIEQRTQARRAGRARRSRPRRALDALYGWTVGYGYRPSRVLWLLALLLVLVAASLKIPATNAALRATDARGNVYTTTGRLITVEAMPTGGSQPPPARPATPTAGEDYSDPARTQPQSDACGDGQVRCFNPVFYAIDTVLPLITLGQRTTWYASPHAPWGRALEWWLHTATLIGWLLTSILVLSFTRLARGP
jgi:hypothetical protein